MSRPLLIRDCRRYDAPPDSPPVHLLLRGGRIDSVGTTPPPPEGAEVLDGGGRLLIPGLIDIHVHGAGGGDVLDGTREALRAMAAALAALGTTSFQGTTVPRPADGNRHLEVASALVGSETGGARLLGIYLEGPFVEPEKRGGIPREAILPCSTALLDEILDRAGGALRMMTLAPELPGALELVERLRSRGVIASFGHSSATYEQTVAGIQAGIRHTTHLFNAMAGLHHRAPGPIPALLEAEDLPVEVIGDGVHLDPRVARFAARVFGLERCVLVTDAMRTAGLPDGRYRYGDRDFESRDGTARYLDGTLIGTSLGLLEVVQRFQGFAGCTFREAVDCATRAPARVLGIEQRTGSIDEGKDADLVLLDPDLSVYATVIGGRVVYRKNVEL